MYVWFQKNVKRYSCWLFVQILLSHSDCCQQSSFFSIFFLWYTKLLIFLVKAFKSMISHF
jgi:hypothetical protein